MSNAISIKKLKRIMYRGLRWRLQIPNYFPHNPIPPDDELTEFSRGVKCAYRDLLQEIDKIEADGNQRRTWKNDEKMNVAYGTYYDDNYDFMEEIRNY